jgi:hypothetical protein
MRPSSYLKLRAGFSLFVILVVSLTFLGSTKLVTHAAMPSFKLSTKLEEVSASSMLNCGGWSVVANPNPSRNDSLYAVTAVSANDVWAVGAYSNSSGGHPLIEHWDGTSWIIVPSPSIGTLNGLTRVSASDIWAVGSYNTGNTVQPLIEHWDGATWSVVPSPSVGTYGYLSGVAWVPSTNQLWSAGSYIDTNNVTQTLIEHWDGTSWIIVPSPSVGTGGSTLNKVTAISANSVWAVGYSNVSTTPRHTLIEHWNGASWLVVPSPNVGKSDNFLYGLTPVSASDIWAVGYYHTGKGYRTLTEHWGGVVWSVVPSPNAGIQNYLTGVTMISTSDIWAVGHYNNPRSQTLTEHWDGTSWSIVPSVNPGKENTLAGVSRVPGTSQIWAVGSYDNPRARNNLTLIEFYC